MPLILGFTLKTQIDKRVHIEVRRLALSGLSTTGIVYDRNNISVLTLEF